MNIAFISSLSHSGSTLLDLLLGTHPRLIGLGEVYKVIRLSPEQLETEKHMRCTCGQLSKDCHFWGQVISDLQEEKHNSLPDRYRTVVQNFKRIFGENTSMVDSSKYGEPLSMLSKMDDIQLRVIHLLKDVRSFTISQRDALPAELKYGHLPIVFGSQAISQSLYLQSFKSPSYLFWKWYLRNRAAQNRLRAADSTFTTISYEEISLSPKASMERLFTFLDLRSENGNKLAPQSSQSHIFLGNQMISDRQKMQGIQYDKRWLSRSDWKIPAALFPHIMAYNRKHIYSRVAEKAIL